MATPLLASALISEFQLVQNVSLLRVEEDQQRAAIRQRARQRERVDEQAICRSAVGALLYQVERAIYRLGGQLRNTSSIRPLSSPTSMVISVDANKMRAPVFERALCGFIRVDVEHLSLTKLTIAPG